MVIITCGHDFVLLGEYVEPSEVDQLIQKIDLVLSWPLFH